MKEIIYLDTNFLHSFLAQYNGGLPTNKSREESEEQKDVSESSEGHKSASRTEITGKSGEIEIPFIVKTPSAQLKTVWQPGQTTEEKAIVSQTETAKEIITTQLHDNALEDFITFLSKETTFVSNETTVVGKYKKITNDFKIIDFDYLFKIIQANKLSVFMFKESDEQYKSLENEIKHAPNSPENRDLKKQFKEQYQEYTKQKEKQLEDLKYIEDILVYLKDILPNSSFILMDGIIAPLKDEFLREKGNELSFKYGIKSNLKITLLGKVTSKFSDFQFNEEDALLQIFQILNVAFEALDLIKKGDYIISPVAIYFE